MMRRVILTLLLILIFIFPVYANSGVKIYNLPILREGKVLNLPLNSYSFWFYISPGVEILDNCYLELKYSYADTLLEKESFLTIYLNGYPLYTKKVVDKTKIPVSVRVKLPKYLFKRVLMRLPYLPDKEVLRVYAKTWIMMLIGLLFTTIPCFI